jgi:hypothetical protein
MIVTADEVHRSFRGTVDLLHNRAEGLQAFDMSEEGFWHSFAAILLTVPAYIVSLAVERVRFGFRAPDASLFDNIWFDLVVAVGHVASFVALPVAMIWLARALGATARYVPFVIVTNWITVAGMLIMSVPTLLFLIGWAPPTLAALFTLAFFFIVFRAQWFATKVTLGVPNVLALAIVSLGLVLNIFIGAVTRGMLI